MFEYVVLTNICRLNRSDVKDNSLNNRINRVTYVHTPFIFYKQQVDSIYNVANLHDIYNYQLQQESKWLPNKQSKIACCLSFFSRGPTAFFFHWCLLFFSSFSFFCLGFAQNVSLIFFCYFRKNFPALIFSFFFSFTFSSYLGNEYETKLNTVWNLLTILKSLILLLR